MLTLVVNPSDWYCVGLSKWVRQKMQYFGMFHNAQQSLQQFTLDRCSKASLDESR